MGKIDLNYEIVSPLSTQDNLHPSVPKDLKCEPLILKSKI